MSIAVLFTCTSSTPASAVADQRARESRLTVQTHVAGDGGVLPGVTVSVRQEGRDAGRGVTDRTGRVTLRVEAGRMYDVTCEFQGGRTHREAILVTQDEAALRVDIAMYARVSLVNLLANGERWDGRPVIVAGFLEIDSEEAALYLHRDDWKWHLSANAVWLEVDPASPMLPRLSQRRRQYVSVWGTFSKGVKGHMGNYGGGIGGIEDFTMITPR